MINTDQLFVVDMIENADAYSGRSQQKAEIKDTPLARKAYGRYQLDWMLSHGYSLADLFSYLDDMAHDEDKENLSPSEYFFSFEDYGFAGGEIYACFDEFLENEYQNEDYMRCILSDTDFEKYRWEHYYGA